MKILKVIGICFIIGIMINIFMAGAAILSFLGPTLSETNVSFINIITNNVTEEEAALIEASVLKNSSEAGKKAADGLISFLSIFFPSPSYEASKKPIQIDTKTPEERQKEDMEKALEVSRELEKATSEAMKKALEEQKAIDEANSTTP